MIDEEVLLEKLEEFIEYDTFDYAQEEPKIVMSFEELEKIIVNQPKVGEWIPCSERLPNDREEKLVYLSSNRITIAIYNEHRLPHSGEPIGWGYEPHKGYIAFEEEIVIAWMPLPQPYKGE